MDASSLSATDSAPKQTPGRDEHADRSAPRVEVARRRLPDPKQINERPVPLSPEQILAANRLHARLTQWILGLRAMAALRSRFPENTADAVLLKIITVNSLHGPNVMSRARVARHLEKVLSAADIEHAGPELVEKLASVPSGAAGGGTRKLYSFASKFAHFFLNPDDFPLMDQTSARMVRYHLGPRSWVPDEGYRYREFAANFRRLRGQSGFKGRKRELSRYLWVAGQYHEWLRSPKARINPELKSLFDAPSPEVAADIETLVPAEIPGSPWL